MHVLIAFITALATLLFALDRIGVDIGWLNPWAWSRRRKWLKQYHGSPAFGLEKPMDAIALLLTAVAKIDGDFSLEEKSELLKIFEDTFKLTAGQASSLLSSSSYLLGSGEQVFQRPADVLAPNLKRFSPDQKTSSIELLSRIANVGGAPSQTQKSFITAVEAVLVENDRTVGWE